MYFNGPLVRSTSNPIVSPGLAPKTNSGLVHLCKHGNNIDYRCSLTSIIAAATSIATFRKRFLDQLKPLFVQVLILAHEMGLMKLGKVSLDGTKIKANASKHHALSWGHACTHGSYCLIGASALVNKNVLKHALMVGNPARQIGWMCACGERLDETLKCNACHRRYQQENGIVREM